jgi:hypothetical protein
MLLHQSTTSSIFQSKYARCLPTVGRVGIEHFGHYQTPGKKTPAMAISEDYGLYYKPRHSQEICSLSLCMPSTPHVAVYLARLAVQLFTSARPSTTESKRYTRLHIPTRDLLPDNSDIAVDIMGPYLCLRKTNQGE